MQIRRSWHGCILLFLLITPEFVHAQPSSMTADDTIADLAGPAPVAGIKFTQPLFDQIVSHTRTERHDYLAELDAERLQYLERIRKHTRLPEELLQKLELAIRIDSARLMTTYARLQRQYVDAALPREAYFTARLEIFQQLTIPLHQPFGKQTLFIKVLRRHASPNDWMTFERLDYARKAAMIESHLTGTLSGPHRLKDTQLEAVISHLLIQYPDWEPLPQKIDYARYISLLALDEQFDELKSILSVSQQELVQKNLITARRFEPTLRTHGLWPLNTK